MKFWEKHFLLLEGALCLVLAAALVGWSESGGFTYVDARLHDNRGALYSALASMFGALLGFVIAAISILLTLVPAPQMALVRKSDHYPILWRTFGQAMWWSAAAAAAGLTALVLDRDASPCRYAMYVVWLTTLLAIARVLRSMWILERVVAIVAKQRT